ncbi:hypothetical protein Mpsy_0249 [Methanolobus psychrophilus R15]|nr:hypothetical protein Mpsy_0249 [Methanolobus psychrophilus R15]
MTSASSVESVAHPSGHEGHGCPDHPVLEYQVLFLKDQQLFPP